MMRMIVESRFSRDLRDLPESNVAQQRNMHAEAWGDMCKARLGRTSLMLDLGGYEVDRRVLLGRCMVG
jgi:hypothetical protein